MPNGKCEPRPFPLGGAILGAWAGLDAAIEEGVPGILAFCNHATNAPFRRCAIDQGQHGYFQASRRNKMEAELATHLEQQRIAPDEYGR